MKDHSPDLVVQAFNAKDHTRAVTFSVDIQRNSSKSSREDGGDAKGLDCKTFVRLMTGNYASTTPASTHVRKAIGQLQLAFQLENRQTAFVCAQSTMQPRLDLQRRSLPIKAKGMVGILLDIIPACVISLNALIMGLEADLPKSYQFWEGCEVFFLLCYILEGLVKMKVFGCREYMTGYDKYWNWFDIACISLSMTDLFIAHLLKYFLSDGRQPAIGGFLIMKMLRLVRLARLVRALHYPIFDELKAMIYGVVSGMRVLFWALLLLFITIFFLGVVLNKLMADTPEISTVPRAMFTIFRCFTDGCSTYDGAPLSERLREHHGAVFLIGYILIITLILFGLFNLIMAIFIDSVKNGNAAMKQCELGQSAHRIRRLFEITFAMLILNEDPSILHESGWRTILNRLSPELKNERSEEALSAFEHLPDDTTITREVFNLWLQDPQVVGLLQEADIDTANKFDLFDILDVDMQGELGIGEFVNGLMALRGPVTKSDIVATRLKVRFVTAKIDEVWNKVGCADGSRMSRIEQYKQTTRGSTRNSLVRGSVFSVGAL